ncbi:ALI_collapsed_G0020650.mRNA.1.CDS.1 [Saccharomyces cerevisiae]|nr:ALI_collapsed_G0020650.mRNA.1.CDS.1 [Saccharomyces cerevisiae]
MIKATPLTAQNVPAPPRLQDTPVSRYISLVVPSGQEILLMSAEPRIQNFPVHIIACHCNARRWC